MSSRKWVARPVGLLGGVVAGALAGAVFARVWRLVSGEDTAPAAGDPSRGWAEVMVAATIQGAIFGAARALVDHTTARKFGR